MHILFALLAHGSLGAGNVLMKKGIDWIGWKGKKSRLYFTQLLIWCLGFVIMNSSGLFTALAVKRLPPHLISAFAGFGILLMILLSHWILRERLFISDLPGALLIVVSMTVLSRYPSENPAVWNQPPTEFLFAVLLFPLLCFVLGTILNVGKAAFFAVSSGSSSAVLIILLKILVARYDYRISLYFSSPILYFYVFFALLALISLQLALKKGAVMSVGPLQYSCLVLYPVLASALLGIPLFLWQWPLFLLVAAGIWLILRKR